MAERDKRPEDYLRFVAVLQNLVESYVDHPNRDEALWLWPVALQLAREYEHAAERFAKVPEGTRHWEEAQFRRAMCQRQAVETARATLDADAYRTRIRAAARALVQYADAALQRANLAIKPDELRAWSAEARLAAAEALSGIGVEDYQGALDLVQSFEQQHPDSELIGRVLSIRIRAYRGLRDFAQASRILQQFLQTAGPTQIGPTLAALAKGMQQEVERLLDSGQAEVARKLAADSVGTFEELEKWVRAKPGRAGNLAFVLSGRARMHYLAGQYEPARQIVATLLKEAPKNGNYQHLRALILSAELTDNAPPAQLEAAQQAWAALLTDPGIRKHAPQRFWEARYNWLALTFRLGNAADVQKAISQERIWTPELGGEPWKSKLEALLAEAEAALGGSPETQPTPDADTKEPGA